jgi:hypothetical protein
MIILLLTLPLFYFEMKPRRSVTTLFVFILRCPWYCIAFLRKKNGAGGFLGGADHYDHTQTSGAMRGGRSGGLCTGYDVRRCNSEGIQTDWSARGNFSTALWTAEAVNVIAAHNRKK